ncbi:hypothetical protein K525DRAFT_255180, partial [Schizophyllum commune Loenen D]
MTSAPAREAVLNSRTYVLQSSPAPWAAFDVPVLASSHTFHRVDPQPLVATRS